MRLILFVGFRKLWCRLAGHRTRHRFGFPQGNSECTRCWKRWFADGSTRG